ncbi:mycofactocin-coupled SDR family oxidoreductase [Pseudonocardia kongjuensis]|uniref:Mycofactocin-coupled SDR family oxidoreductase n=1 Tax=Pseudonocardia kongjuensis TaxID=102227 RepID=A0ABN1XKJ3_9PSEU
MGSMEGTVAFITGAARGQGRNHAVRLAEQGADIIAVDVCAPVDTVPYPTATEDDLAETVRLVEGLGRRIVARTADVRDLAGLTKAVDEGVGELGRLDVVLANAGITGGWPTLEMPEEAWQTMLDVNLTGVWKTVRASVGHILDGGRGGSVVITSSTLAWNTFPNTAAYAASKAGLLMLMKVLAKELAPQGIRVNTVHPTTVATDMVLNESTYRAFRPDLENPGRADWEEAARTINTLPIAAVEVDDITGAVLYLVGGTGRYVTGTALEVGAGTGL